MKETLKAINARIRELNEMGEAGMFDTQSDLKKALKEFQLLGRMRSSLKKAN
jgi:hypothetical protein